MTLPFVDITPENGWFFTIVSQANRPAEKIFSAALQNIKHHKVCIELGYLGATAVEGAVDKFLSKKPKPERFVCVAPLSKQYIVNTHRALQASFRNLSREMIKNAVNKRCGLLFGATLWGGRQVYDLIDIMRFVRAESEGQAVCIVGGPLLGARDPELEALLFEGKADILNIGGGREIAEWIANLSPEKRFERDTNGNLHTIIPENAPFFTALANKETQEKGSSIVLPLLYKRAEENIVVDLPGIGCANKRCGFCSIPAHIKGHQAKHYAQFSQFAAMAREIMSDPQTPVQTLCFVNPNLMQRTTPLRAFLSGLDLGGLKGISHFAEVPSLRDPAGLERHLAYADEILTQNPNLELNIRFSFDAVQEESDGAFLGRYLGAKALREEDFRAIEQNFFAFLNEAKKRGWADRLGVGLNLILHPAMTPEIYRQKKALSRRVFDVCGKKSSFGIGVLEPFIGSDVARDWKNHYAPLLYMEKDWALGHEVESEYLSCWGNQFKQGDLLDCYMLTRFFAARYEMPFASFLMGHLLDMWNWDKAGIDSGEAEGAFLNYDDLAPRKRDHVVLRKKAREIVTTEGPRLLPLLNVFVEPLLQSTGRPSREQTICAARYLHAVTFWFHRREKYLMEHNAAYAKNPHCAALVEGTGKLLERFGPFLPMIRARDERPRGRIPQPPRWNRPLSPTR